MNEHFLVFHPKAEAEYLEAVFWYETKSQGLGISFSNSVEDSIQKIGQNPLVYPVKKAGRREALVKDFPFLIVYKFYPSKNLIHILAVFHTKRHPNKKARK